MLHLNTGCCARVSCPGFKKAYRKKPRGITGAHEAFLSSDVPVNVHM